MTTTPGTPSRLFRFDRRSWLLGCAVAAAAAPFPAAHAQSEPFVGQMLWTAATFCPRDWAEANGQLLSIAQNSALFSLIGTTYGGDGETTFALPDLRGRSQVHVGQGPGLGNFTLGDSGGTESVALTTNNLPAHSHALRASSSDGTSASAVNGVLASPKASSTASPTATATSTPTASGTVDIVGKKSTETLPLKLAVSVNTTVDVSVPVQTGVMLYGNPGTANVSMAADSIGNTGAGQPVAVRSPHLAMRACIAMFGIFPQQN